jgi:hypothetical protein
MLHSPARKHRVTSIWVRQVSAVGAGSDRALPKFLEAAARELGTIQQDPARSSRILLNDFNLNGTRRVVPEICENRGGGKRRGS